MIGYLRSQKDFTQKWVFLITNAPGMNGNAMHLTNDPQELLYLLKSIQSNIVAKLTESNYN